MIKITIRYLPSPRGVPGTLVEIPWVIPRGTLVRVTLGDTYGGTYREIPKGSYLVEVQPSGALGTLGEPQSRYPG